MACHFYRIILSLIGGNLRENGDAIDIFFVLAPVLLLYSLNGSATSTAGLNHLLE
jgi:hypothetical protein